jgi:hypothetical protein
VRHPVPSTTLINNPTTPASAIPATYTPAGSAASHHTTLVPIAYHIAAAPAVTVSILPHTGGGEGGVPSTPGLPMLPIAISLLLIVLGALSRRLMP